MVSKFPLPHRENLPQELVAVAEKLGLTVTRLSLSTLPRNLHLHLKSPGRKGVLEATILLDSGEGWMEVRGNRDSPWIAGTIETILSQLAQS